MYRKTVQNRLDSRIWGDEEVIKKEGFFKSFFGKNKATEIQLQQRYYELSKTKEPTLEQKCALSLDVIDDFYYNSWNETLEDYPMESFYNMDYKFFHKNGYSYVTTEDRINELLKMSIKNEEDYTNVMKAYVYSDIFIENVPNKFIDDCLFSDDANKNIEKLSKISKISEEKIISYITPQGEIPARSVWAYVWQNAIFITRLAYEAEIISRDVAWENLLKISSYVHYLFEDFEDYYTNVILGTAYKTLNSEKVDEKYEMLELYKKECNWPQKTLPWERKKVELPPDCAKMTLQGIEEEKNKDYKKTIQNNPFSRIYKDEENYEKEKKNQLRYYKLANIYEPTLEQRCALSLEVIKDFYYSCWNETLENYPMESIYMKDNDFFYENGYKYVSTENRKKSLSNWGIENEEDYLNEIYFQLYSGNIPSRFMDYCLFNDDAKQNIEKISKISKLSEEKIISYITPQGDLPAKSIWAYVWENVIYITRLAYEARVISSEVAWENLLKVSSFVHYLFEDLEDYYLNIILGTAYFRQDSEEINVLYEKLELYKKECNWPQKNLPWERKKVELPPNCAKMNELEIEEEKNKDYKKTIQNSLFSKVYMEEENYENEKNFQLRYYKLANIKETTLQQKYALNLDLVQDFNRGFWNETIENAPLERIKDIDPNLFNRINYTCTNTKNQKDATRNDWGIENKDDYLVTFERLCYYGYHNDSFIKDCLFSYEAEKNIKHLSEISKISEEKIRTYLTPQGDLPIRGIWAFEWWRALAVTRGCYKCGYISQDEAWENLLLISGFAHYLFEDLEDFFTNYVLGVAFWINEPNYPAKRMEELEEFKNNCDWPQRDLPWIRKKVKLPRSCARMTKEKIEKEI